MAIAAGLFNRLRRINGDTWMWVGSPRPLVVAGGHSHRMALVQAINWGRVDLPAAVLTNSSKRIPIGFVDHSYWARINRLPVDIPVAVLWMGNELNERFLFADDAAFSTDAAMALTVKPMALLERTLDDLSPRRVVLVGPPPPKSDATVRSNLANEPRFVAILEQHGVSAESAPLCNFELRRQLWELHRAALANVATRHGAGVLPVIAAAIADDGSLRNEYAAKDVSHANQAYGELLWQGIADHFGIATGDGSL